MITEDIFNILISDSFTGSVKNNIDRNPVDVALDKRIENAQLVASQIKRLKKASKKLPSFFKAWALLPDKAYEQSSSELCAEEKHLSGRKLLDLTCGLGVDSYILSKRFNRVVSVERDPMTAKIAQENFRRLGVENIEVVSCSAEQYLKQCSDHFDWCLIDPDRRDGANHRNVLLEQCSPNVLQLKHEILRVADKACIKCSPLFDVDECFRKFESCNVEVVSMDGECREVNIYLGQNTSHTITSVSVGQGKITQPADYTPTEWTAIPDNFDSYRYLIIPDPAVRHARICRFMLDKKADIWSDDGIALATTLHDGILGKIYSIDAIHEYKPRQLKKLLGKHRIEIMRHGIRESMEEIIKALGVREGGEEKWCFTRIGTRTWAFLLKGICY